MLPTAVASTGPATRRLPQASAVSWQRSLICVPPPTMLTVVILRPATRSSASMTHRHLSASPSRTTRTVSPTSRGGDCLVSRQTSAIFPGMFPGTMNRRSSRSMTAESGFAFSASAMTSSHEKFFPAEAHSLRHCCSGQSPMMFLSSRVVPATPSSLLSFASSAALVTTGVATSTPSSDHVPDDRKAQSSPCPGHPATAAAVSCDAEAYTGYPSLSPRQVPASTSRGKRRLIGVVVPRSSASFVSQCRVRGSMSEVVLASVTSERARPPMR